MLRSFIFIFILKVERGLRNPEEIEAEIGHNVSQLLYVANHFILRIQTESK